ncbi:MAG: glycosyltransferase family 4 protein [Terriglobales bacterium]
MLTSVHGAFDVRIYEKEARSLVVAGYEVTIVVPHARNEIAGGVTVRAIQPPRSRGKRMTRTIWQVYAEALRVNASVYHFHDPELIPVGLLLKLLHGKRVVYDVHEDVPRDIMNKEWIVSVLRAPIARAAEGLEAAGACLFDAVVAATPTIAQRFPKKKTFAVHNFPHPDSFLESCTVAYQNRLPLIVYVGGISTSRGGREMVEAMDRLRISLGARLQLAGAFETEDLRDELSAQSGWERIDFLGWLSYKRVCSVINRCRIGLVILHSTPAFRESLPLKLFEYMSAGLPVVASNFPCWREIVEDSSCGLLVNPLDPQAIAEAIQWLLDHPQEAEEMGRRGAAAVRSKFNWSREEEKLLRLYAHLTNGRQSGFVGDQTMVTADASAKTGNAGR